MSIFVDGSDDQLGPNPFQNQAEVVVHELKTDIICTSKLKIYYNVLSYCEILF